MKRQKLGKRQGKAQKRPGSIPAPCPGNQLTPDQYLEHWLANKVWRHLEKERHQKRLRWCAEQCRGEAFADVGCMLGHSTAIMARFKKGEWTGIDFSYDAIQQARKLFPQIGFLYYAEPKMMTWPLAGCFDSVVCSEVLEHVKDDRAFLEMLFDITRSRLILTTPVVDAQDPGHVRLYTDDSLSALLAGATQRGWIVQRQADESFFYITIERPK